MDAATPRNGLAANHQVTAWCLTCGHSSELDLPELILRGFADTSLLELPLRCKRCGNTRFRLVVTWSGQGGSAV